MLYKETTGIPACHLDETLRQGSICFLCIRSHDTNEKESECVPFIRANIYTSNNTKTDVVTIISLLSVNACCVQMAYFAFLELPKVTIVRAIAG